jgi:ABC-2 type transport system permease protein
MSTAGTLPWMARHELRLAWRDFVAMATGGRRTRAIGLALFLVVFAAGLHWFADLLLRPWITAGIAPDKTTLVLVSVSGLLFWTVMLSQALESVTRAYYARSDLDLVLSSPVSSRRLFAVRTGAVALTSMLLACLLASPMLNVLAWRDGLHWLSAYAVLAALAALATALAVLVTISLFRLAGPRRTRLISQIIAGVVGAGFVIGIQAVAILNLGSLNRFDLLQSPDFVAAMPPPESLLWLPARAAMGSLAEALLVLALGLAILALVIAHSSSSFAQYAIAAAGVSQARVTQAHARPFRAMSQRQALRAKEWKLLARDPWLLSQTLMQILYLLPPALFLWVSYGEAAGSLVVVVPVVVMGSGQLAGGLAWLAISGEDAHDLVVTAPIPARAVLLAKIEAVLAVIGLAFAPILLLIALGAPATAGITAAFVALSAGAATAIQLWFRVPMRRAMFRRRQVASRAATISEALSSIMWAGAAVLAASGLWLAVIPSAIALLVLGIAWAVSPKGKRG